MASNVKRFQSLVKTLILLSIELAFVSTGRLIQFKNGGYRGLVVAIHSDVPESEQLINNLEELLRKSSAFLYEATDRRARFVEFEVVIPKTWSDKDHYESIAGLSFDQAHIRVVPTDQKTGDQPYTHQPRGCGQPGEYIVLTDAFLEELEDRTRENFGYPGWHLTY